MSPPHKSQDPVCKMTVTTTMHQTSYKGETYLFCSRGCLEKFTKAPHTYTHPLYVAGRNLLRIVKKTRNKIKKKLATVSRRPLVQLGLVLPTDKGEKPSTTTRYTCPMHPEVIRNNPQDTCPDCGMALEPILTPGESSDALAYEQVSSRRLLARFVLSLLLTLPIMSIEMVPAVGTSLPYASLITLLFTTLIMFGTGSFVLTRAVNAFKNRTLNMFSLVALGTLTAYLYSTLILVLLKVSPEWIPPIAYDANGKISLYFETAAVIVTLVILGQVLEDAARKRTSRALRDLMDLSPTTALRVHPAYYTQTTLLTQTKSASKSAPALSSESPSEMYETILLQAIQKEDVLLVQPGAKIPVDGIVLNGESEVDEALLTGEAQLVGKGAGSKLLGGTLNKTGALMMRAEKVGHETFLAEIIALTEQAQRSHPPIQDFTERVTRIFIPTVIATAVLSFGMWFYFGPSPSLSYALLAFVSVLIVACPCALGLATPMAITVGISRGAEKGVLIKDAVLLEQFTNITLVAIDKTGTLTHGKPTLTQHTSLVPKWSSQQVLQLAASLEILSEHPLAHGFSHAMRRESLSLLPVTEFKATPGEGISGSIGGKTYSIGSLRMMKQRFNLSIPAALTSADPSTHGSTATPLTTVLFLTDHEQIIATFSLTDTLKPSATTALLELKKRRIKVVLLSGDRQVNCEAVGKELSHKINNETGKSFTLDEIHGDLRPQDKFEKIEAFKRSGYTVLMAGDGVNDAPALAASHLSVAMGTGSDAALATAHATLLKGDLKSLSSLFTLSQKTITTIRGNLFFAFFYNAASVPLAAGILYPLWNITFSPMLAALLMILSSLSVIGNALRLRTVPI